MEKLITYPTLRNFAYSNDKICQKPIRGIALSFFGLGGKEMFAEDTELGLFLAEKGIILIIPYTNPWSWMNKQAVAYTDELIDVIMEEYGLPEDLPIVSTGGSMGGQSALVYTAYAKRTPKACVANCPVCDLPYHFTERPDLPRTLYSAFGQYDCSLEEALQSASPLHLAEAGKMPDVKYTIYHCTEDKAVNKEMHSDRFVVAMHYGVNYFAVPDRGQCDLPPEFRESYNQAIVSACMEG